MSLPCLNCKAGVEPDDGRLFMGVFVCKLCHDSAERLHTKLQQELKMLLTMSKETIRIALIEGKLHFGEAKIEEVPKTELLRQIVALEDLKDKRGAVLPDGRKVKPR